MQRNRALLSSVLATGLGLVMASQAESAIYLDLGELQPYNAVAPAYDFTYNTISGASPGTFSVANLVDQNNVATGISYTTTDIWVGTNSSGATSTVGTPAEEFQKASRDALYLDNANSTAAFVLGNLTAPSYNLTFFGNIATVTSTNRPVSITAQGAGAPVVVASYNTGNDNGMAVANLVGVVPDGSGQITVTIAKLSGNFAYMTAAKIVAVPEPASLGLLSLGGLALLRRRRQA